jgi:hypothetical protein
MKNRFYKFSLTTGDVQHVPYAMDGEPFDWQGEVTLAEIGMVADDENPLNITCLTPKADRIARAVSQLWDAEAVANDLPDADRDAAIADAWETFCATN